MTVFITSAIAAVVPILVGFVWYHNSVFGKTWMNVAGVTEEKIKSGNMGLILGLTLFFSYLLGLALSSIVIHQGPVMSLAVDGTPEVQQLAKDLVAKAGTRYNTFKHGVFHGIIAALFFALPVLGINALFERRGAKYIFIHLGYWVITIALMGGIICQFTTAG